MMHERGTLLMNDTAPHSKGCPVSRTTQPPFVATSLNLGAAQEKNSHAKDAQMYVSVHDQRQNAKHVCLFEQSP